ncbi:MAG: para-aminobenzoate synthetase / 4-amino-4-deoxychorismate lyase [Sphingomonadales bacterium]|jgi:para-aminobenzoate synthetase/4-amino-4-deoxychorismate lyase|nr:para-aminobenzoate synthetase / 4-amino-4-deoxychorismate lyase [Sphingomonadales bacterium]
MASLSGPFVLLDDARAGGRARLFTGLRETIVTRDPEAVVDCLERLRGKAAAGFLAYEAGHALEAKLAPLRVGPAPDEPPLLWFGLFDSEEEVDAESLLPDPAGAWAGKARPLISRAEYEAALAAVKAHILAGDVYQANLTFAAEVPVAGHPLALYAALRARARAGHGALAYTGTHWLLSLSPELFFTLEGGRVTTRPMKGTAPRDADPAAFAADPKQRAENLMIVDLLRNDLSRVAKAGSVDVPVLFAVESYPTILQLTSTVTAELEDGLGPIDLIRAIYPCGSITGAPKIRAMEIIDALEASPRGAYCGMIGRLAPDGEAAFNVAIRTLTLRDGETIARLGLGSGIVADSSAGEEWRECLAKGAFVETATRFDLIETMRFDPQDGVVDLDRHLERLKASADALDFAFDRHEARNELQAATFRAGPSRVRLMLARTGALAIEMRPLERAPDEPVAVAVASLPVPPDDFRLRHKTSDRAFYDEARAAAGTFEILFRDSGGFLTEGSFTSLFVERGGMLVTPPLGRGLLPGILRGRLIEEGRAAEGDLVEADLAGGFYIGNAVRGLVRARLRSGRA